MILRKRQLGFTLMELLIVIAIIGLLVTIMFPSINQILKRSYKVKSMGAFQELSNAALQFKNATEYYPGQKEDLSHCTGSQALAICLLGGVEIDSNGDIIFKDDEGVKQSTISSTFNTLTNNNAQYIKSDYIEYSKDRFMELNGRPLTPSDQWKTGEEMAMLYYPAILGNDGSPAGAFDVDNDYANNNEYGATFPTNATQLKDNLKLTTGKFGDVEVKNSDSFLLIAPSLDRQYFWNTATNKCDDITNY